MTEVQLALAEAARQDGDNGLLRETSEKLVRDNPWMLVAIFCELRLKETTSRPAERDLKKAIEISPQNASAYVAMGNFLDRDPRGERNSAIATAYQLVPSGPQDAHSYFFAGTMEEFVGRTEKAEELYRKALQIEPNYAPAANNFAYLMVQRGEDLDSALSLAQIARQKMPDSSGAADTLAWVYYHKGLYGVAAGLLREALQRSPRNATYHYHLGMIYEKQNNKAAARTQLELALQINPKDPDAIHSRDTFR